MAGEAFLGAAFGVLLDRLASEEFINFFRGRKHDESLLKKLKVTLLELNKGLNDAEERQITDQAVKAWLDELKDAVYQAEDLVDEIATEALRSKVEAEYPRGKQSLQDSVISTFTSFFDRGVNSKLEKMIGMLDHFVKAKDVLGLREVATRKWSQTRLPTTSLVDESCVYGRENDKEEIMKLLLSDGENMGRCSGIGINELGEFDYLRGTISISGLQNVKSGNDALEAKMSEKKYLEKLALKWDSITEDSQNARDVLEKLEPHTNLKHLEIKNYGGTRFPTWLGDQSFCNMVSLRLENCKNCFSLPPLGQLPSLKELTIARMSNITNVGHEFYGESGSLSKPFQSLETLRFEKMSGWVDWCILDAGEFSRLQKLEVEECPELVTSLPRTTFIRELLLKECRGVQLEWRSVSSVEKLEISSFASLKEFPSELATLTNLKELSVEKCPRLYVPEMSNCNMFLESLELVMCESLISLPLGLFPKLRDLVIGECTNFETLLIPEGIELQNMTFLKTLTIEGCKKLKALPEQMHTLLPSLQSLTLIDCPEIESFPEGGLPSKLDNLYIRNCKKLVVVPRGGALALHGSTLTYLYFQDLPNLKSLNKRGLQLLGSLKRIHISECPQLQSLPEEGLPTSLIAFSFDNCPLLKPRCRREEGEDWHKIAHIPFIVIDHELISD
ncbi:hypothetical protein RHSIM_Rhsim09G0040600 [Rhododendron simsii]|uniref:Rx N-terminal domain-containing protein n=1 Tax=Rhododendron simsii TaxID=118357 RepID=A0A834LFF2_RHOSS|nr:hypothetical protein RHSIM_Rhsim09G0040600 [Rhododendron simsii]